MINKRAFFLIDKSQLNDKDKAFLRTHLETHKEIILALQTEIMSLKDALDYGKFIDNQIMVAKEELLNLLNEKDIENVKENLSILLRKIEKL